MTTYRLGWAPGNSAVFELRQPTKTRVETRFTPRLRGTLRLPAGSLSLASLNAVNDQTRTVFAHTPAARHGGPRPAPPATTAQSMKTLGRQLFDLALPPDVGSELEDAEQYLEIGTDETLQKYPWELMHDGREFYCLRHYIGRYVYVSEGIAGGARRSKPSLDPFDPLRALIVCVHKPPQIGTICLPTLRNAFEEMKAVTDVLGLLDVEADILGDGAGTYDAVYNAVSERQYQIVHFIGHTYVDPKNPEQSGLVLQDKLMTAGEVNSFLRNTQPVLCFMNGCESSRPLDERVSLGKFGLARAILETGAYLLGARALVSDGPASTFAQAFYRALLGAGQPIGQAVTTARIACREAFPGNPAWASYAYYGDPRVGFTK